MAIPTYLALYQDHSEHRYTSDNPFVVDVYIGDYYKCSEPNWALIIPVALAVIAVIIVASFLIYRHWRKKNCHPVYFAGKVTYLRKGALLHDASDFIDKQKANLAAQGLKVTALFSDAEQTVPLEMGTVITAPIFIYPKIEK